MAKQVTLVVDGLFAHTMGVLKGRINPMHALAAASMVDTMVRASAEESKHQRYQKKVPKVKFFDTNITEQTAAQAVQEVINQEAENRKAKALARKLLKVEVEEKFVKPVTSASKKILNKRK
jgi:hypothetical protein